MATKTVRTKQSSSIPFLPRAWTSLIRLLSGKFFGIVMMILAFFLLVSFISYHQTDASLNAASQQSIKNWGGEYGAYVADFLLQGMGLSAVVIALWLMVWGWRRYAWGELLNQWRIITLIVGVLCLSVGLASITAPSFWNLQPGLGGVMGMLLLGTGHSITSQAFYIGLVALIASFLLLRYSFAIGHKQLFKVIMALPAFSLLWIVGTVERFNKKRRYEAPRSKPVSEKKPALPRLKEGIKDSVQKAVLREDTADINMVESPVAPPLTKQSARKEKRKKVSPPVEGEKYTLPPLDLLEEVRARPSENVDKRQLREREVMLQSVLEDFGVRGQIVGSVVGPIVTLYELEPAPGIKSSRIISLADDIARSMSALSARVAVVPGRNIIGIELPNDKRQMVSMRDILAHESFGATKAKLPLAVGKNISGEPVTVDLAKMPHLLVAGTTGSGKSVSVNTMILSLLYCLTPEQCRFIMVDPKMLELSVYNDIPHLLAPVVTDPKKAVVALKWTVREMEQRYQSMSRLGVRNITGYNQRIQQAIKKGEVLNRRVQTGFDPDTNYPVFEDQPLPLEPLPYIVVIVDEMADLMLVAGKEIEATIQRLAQMARAAGIHLIMATQRPSVDVITGTIKANFPTRMSFQVTSKIDSRTILGEMGAEQLLGQGDMLYMAGGGRISRVHGSFISDEEVEDVVAYLKAQGTPDYVEDVTVDTDGLFTENATSSGDEMYDQAVSIVRSEGKISTSFIQRKLSIGYNRAAKIVEQMEEEGIISAAGHNGKREVL